MKHVNTGSCKIHYLFSGNYCRLLLEARSKKDILEAEI